ncbi:MAG: EAL domain-containing protein [Geminocystis sp.]|nr:EAL domain-containing protein [Geminocystis sp.]HIK38731.1 EAL domain-containing protein [Geminocystis sp. M7585_C2015_104]MCS7148591.1 EAL domain-containing protein [Geminocystis sp.]MCX8078146.1 EAL domain-containing protein [Geminocystis sp.]MDW8115017.1 EAL domain-containing protein [Geminocystis sp.]
MGEHSNSQHILTIKYGDVVQRISLNQEVYSVGRHSSNKIVIHHPIVSRFHCTILPVKYKGEAQQNLFWIIDGDLKGNRSSNGIFVNGNKILSHELKTGDIIHIGGEEIEMTYEIIEGFKQDSLSVTTPPPIDSEGEVNGLEQKSTLLKKAGSDTTVPEKTKGNGVNFFLNEILFILEQSQYQLSCPQLKISSDNKLIEANDIFRETFPHIELDENQNPFLKNAWLELEKSRKDFSVREVEYEGKIYSQYLRYTPDRKAINSYIFSFCDRYNQEKTLRENEEKYRAIVRQISEGIILVDPATKKIIEANPAYCSLVGYKQEEIVSLRIYDVVATDPEINDNIIGKVQRERLNITQESVHRHRGGSLIDVEVNVSTICYGAKEYICYAVRDITERKMAEGLLYYQASHDWLTRLGNRSLFNDKLQKAIARARRYNGSLAVIFIDLDRFKNINDTLGHDVGDRFLQQVAIRLKNSLTSRDTIARWGGDEFTILLPEITNPEDVAIVAKRIFESFQQPIVVAEYQLYCHLSMGVAIYPQDGETPETLVRNADVALYRSKDNGGNQYQFYNPSMNQRKEDSLHLETHLYRAIENKQLYLVYQPQINIHSGQVVGVEALLRWLHPEWGIISPADFIPIAEETGYINTIGEWVLYTACLDHKRWQEAGLPPIKTAINLSARQCQPSLLPTIKGIIRETQIDPNHLELEITETTIIAHPDLTREILQELTLMGISIAIDDFGAGYSSLSYLKKFPFKKIKIDQSFVGELKEDSPEDVAIISAIITLGKGFNLEVVAEGVENTQQAGLLERLGCKIMQGYLFSKPLLAEEIIPFIKGKI